MKLILTIIVIIFISFCQSCKKFVDIGPPTNSITGKQQFSDSVNATSAVLGIYTYIMSSSDVLLFLHGGVTIHTGLSCDEIVPTSNSKNEMDLYFDGVKSNNSYVYLWWSNAYNQLYQINTSIEGITASPGILSSCKDQLIGEAKFMRALTYFYLVNLFGPVPLVTSSDYRVNATMARTSVDSIHSSIIGDLIDAMNLLSENYISAGKVRPNKFAAAALLAREYLYLGKWKESEEMATLVINSNKYALENDLTKVFLANSTEAIFQLIPTQLGRETVDGNLFIPYAPAVVPSYYITQSLLNSFEVNDKRKDQWLGYNVVNANGTDVVYYYPNKYRAVSSGASVSKENYMFLRLGELFLIRAEARANQNILAGSNSAFTDLNLIRQRAGLNDTIAAVKADALNIIYKERRSELFLELGHRWFDLIRTNQIDTVMTTEAQAKGSSWVKTARYFPIPFLQILANPFLRQNDGYN